MIVVFLFACFRNFAITIGYGEIPANMTRIFFGAIFVILSAIIFRSLESLGEKYVSSTFILNLQPFSLWTVSFVFSPARCFVLWTLRRPEILSVFSTTVVIVLCCFRNFLDFSFLTMLNVFLGNFRMAMLPMRS